MPTVNFPWSGAVSQAIEAWASLFTAMGSQFGLININYGATQNPKLEETVVSGVASYGKQLGRVEDALLVLMKYANLPEDLPEDEQRAIDDLNAMLIEIADVKEQKGAVHVLRPVLKRPATRGRRGGRKRDEE